MRVEETLVDGTRRNLLSPFLKNHTLMFCDKIVYKYIEKNVFHRPMNNFQIIDILIDELQRMHTENLIHIRDHGDFNDYEFRSFRCRYSQKVQG